MKEGLIHIYTGDGKGKTTAATGLSIRAAGAGLIVQIGRFLKTDNSSELDVLESIDNIQVERYKKKFGFTWTMTDMQKEETKEFFTKYLKDLQKKVVEEKIDLLVLDEIISTYNLGFIDCEDFLRFLKTKPKELEIVLTGREPASELVEIADYVTEMKKIKHPFDKGMGSRKGIED